MIKVRIRPFISGSVDWFPPNTVIPGPESDVIWWIVTNFVVICAVTFFIMNRSIPLFTTLFFFYRDPSIIWSYSIRPLSWPMFISPLALPDRFILFSLLLLWWSATEAPICCVARSKHSNWLYYDKSRQSH